ncbi:UDP-N-acetylglucosamine 4,6-dehydratase (inverting) [Myxococcota bacterium]|nr:UDP-N-acetylglucosamine 4,6-dehydratase (inverting) [Myxococcota bacterium]
MFDGASVLVTGGTGSFGRRFVRMLLDRYRPRRVIVFSRDEFKQHEMAAGFTDPAMRFFIGDVRDERRLWRALNGVDYVVHAAALKHVPAAEYNPSEFVKTNILGSQNVVDACLDRGVRRVVALSTDKACNPINLYGATKLCADKLFVAGNSYRGAEGTRFAVVRYGNVVGSRGSVIPAFAAQRPTGRLTITDRRMTRFWITLDEAVRLVWRAFADMEGGEVFVPKIPSMRLVDLAHAVAPECELVDTGIRPGEKLHEAMISPDDAPYTVEYDDCYVIRPAIHAWSRDEAGPRGRPVPSGFTYTSDLNDRWLDAEGLRALIEGMKPGDDA